MTLTFRQKRVTIYERVTLSEYKIHMRNTEIEANLICPSIMHIIEHYITQNNMYLCTYTYTILFFKY